ATNNSYRFLRRGRIRKSGPPSFFFAPGNDWLPIAIGRRRQLRLRSMCKIWGSEGEMRHRFLLACAALALCLAPARADNDLPGLAVEPLSIELRGQGADHGFLVSADGRDVTKEATCVSSNPKVAAAEPEITVTYGGNSAKIKVAASGTSEAAAPSFRNEVVPVLTRFGCNQG